MGHGKLDDWEFFSNFFLSATLVKNHYLDSKVNLDQSAKQLPNFRHTCSRYCTRPLVHKYEQLSFYDEKKLKTNQSTGSHFVFSWKLDFKTSASLGSSAEWLLNLKEYQSYPFLWTNGEVQNLVLVLTKMGNQEPLSILHHFGLWCLGKPKFWITSSSRIL